MCTLRLYHNACGYSGQIFQSRRRLSWWAVSPLVALQISPLQTCNAVHFHQKRLNSHTEMSNASLALITKFIKLCNNRNKNQRPDEWKEMWHHLTPKGFYSFIAEINCCEFTRRIFNLRPGLHSWPNEHLYLFHDFLSYFYRDCSPFDNYKSHHALQKGLSDTLWQYLKSLQTNPEWHD